MHLKNLLKDINIKKSIGRIDVDILDVQFDSRKIVEGGLFVCVKGDTLDGHKYIQQSINNGARAILLQSIPEQLDDNVVYIQIKDTRSSLGVIASNFYNHPSKRIKLIGVTGTNGKTTIVSLLHQACTLLNKKAGLISTIQNKIVNQIIPATHTTPDALEINYLLNRMILQGCKYCFMEVSSHAIAQSRIKNLHFFGGVFTNITQDHLDYHKTFDEYINVKKSFFDSLGYSAFSLVNNDDKNYFKMIENTQSIKLTYSLKSFSDYKCRIIESQIDSTCLNINKMNVWVKLIGEFNAYNILAVYAIVDQLGFADEDFFTALSKLQSPEGRFEYVNSNNIIGIVDYAHTHDALKNVLSAIDSMSNKINNIITVIGCGGERDVSKRPLMARVACNSSSKVILTSDNPRSENPEKIIDDMIEGLDSSQRNKILVVVDRRAAIKKACEIARSNDVVLIAGKGHEKYQEVNGKRNPFDDLEELKESFNIKQK